MKIGEALQERAAAHKLLADVRERIGAYAVHDEDETPAEHATALLAEANQLADRLGDLVGRINATNSATPFPGGGTVTDALARRDALSAKITTLEGALRHVVNGRERAWRASGPEVRRTVAIDVTIVRAQLEAVSAERRRLDAQLQRLSWEVDLLD